MPAFAAEVARAEFSPPARGRGQRLLLVDDEPAIAKSGQMILERLGYRVAVFTNASTALAHFWMAPEAVDALVTDLQMPEMTGRELARKILARRPGLPVFIVSGVAGAANADELRREGVTAILDKPVDFAKAAAALARAFG